jgi:hypothetical protein
LVTQHEAEAFGRLIQSSEALAAAYSDADLATIRDFLGRSRERSPPTWRHFSGSPARATRDPLPKRPAYRPTHLPGTARRQLRKSALGAQVEPAALHQAGLESFGQTATTEKHPRAGESCS